jgi:hypothetical protein
VLEPNSTVPPASTTQSIHAPLPALIPPLVRMVAGSPVEFPQAESLSTKITRLLGMIPPVSLIRAPSPIESAPRTWSTTSSFGPPDRVKVEEFPSVIASI